MMGPYSRFVRTERDKIGQQEADLTESSNDVRALRQALSGGSSSGGGGSARSAGAPRGGAER